MLMILLVKTDFYENRRQSSAAPSGHHPVRGRYLDRRQRVERRRGGVEQRVIGAERGLDFTLDGSGCSGQRTHGANARGQVGHSGNPRN